MQRRRTLRSAISTEATSNEDHKQLDGGCIVDLGMILESILAENLNRKISTGISSHLGAKLRE